jgi:hypothetical protein
MPPCATLGWRTLGSRFEILPALIMAEQRALNFGIQDESGRISAFWKDSRHT